MAKKKSSGFRREAEEEKTVRSVFDEFIEYVKSHSADPDIADIQDLDGTVLKRRIQAVLALLPQVRSRYAREEADESVLTEDFARLCGAPGYRPDEIEENYLVSLAAALWMLDELEQAGTLSEIHLYLPERKDIEYNPLPSGYTDAFHNLAPLKGLTVLIQYLAPMGPNYYMTDFFAKMAPSQGHPKPDFESGPLSEQELFDAVLSEIPQGRIEHAVQYFEKKYWEFMDISFSVLSHYHTEIERTKEQLSAGPPSARPGRTSGTLSAPLSGNGFSQTGRDSFPFSGGSFGNPSGKQAGRLDGAWFFSTMSKLQTLTTRQNFMGAFLSHVQEGLAAADPSFSLNPEDVDRVLSFDIEDPCELCFGYLYLLDSGSDLPWTYNPANSVLLAACRKLPWAVTMPESSPGEEEREPEKASGGNGKESREREKDGSPESLPDVEDPDSQEGACPPAPHPGEALEPDERNALLYRELYQPDPILDAEGRFLPGRRLNLSQVIYSYTKSALPRTFPCWRDCAGDLEKSGMTLEEAKAVELCINLLSALPLNGSEALSLLDSLEADLQNMMDNLSPAPGNPETPSGENQDPK